MGLEAVSPIEDLEFDSEDKFLGLPRETWFKIWIVHTLLRLPAGIVSGIHGYRRNREDTAMGAVWGFLGFTFPIITTTVAVAQGYGKPA